MSKMTLNVELLAGTNIKDAIKEAKNKARQYDLAYVEFNFNSRKISVGQNANIEDMIEQFDNGETFIVSA